MSALRASVSDEKLRVQLDLHPQMAARMNRVMGLCGLETRKELFNNAVTLLEWAANEAAQGHRIAAFNDDTHERTVLTMPALVHASEYRAAHEQRTQVSARTQTAQPPTLTPEPAF